MEIRTLFIEDNEQISKNLKSYFHEENFSGNILIAENTIKFEEGISFIEQFDYDLVVLDLYKEGANVDEAAGIKVLEAIRKIAFIPVIFYTGHAHKVEGLASEIVGVVRKGDFDDLKAEIQRIVDSKIALLKQQVYHHLKESLRQYFWETVDAKKKVFEPSKNDISIGYLLLRRFANSLSKENIKTILGDNKIEADKVHPMEFYIYPVNNGEYEAGEILVRNENKYILLTPSCDYILRSKKDKSTYRDVGRILLARIFPLSSCDQYVKYKSSKSKNTEDSLKEIITNKKSRFFFLPGTPFIENSIIDFQSKTMVEYEDLARFERVARLDDPFAQSMLNNFIRYYNRIGFPDIDSDYIIENL